MRKFLFSDIDHTISTFDHEAGMRELQKYMSMSDKFDRSLARKICNFMDKCYAAFLTRARGGDSKDLQKLEELIREASGDIRGAETFSDMHWSREFWIYLGAGGGLSPKTSAKAAQRFWKGVRESAMVYQDAEKFFNWLRDHNWGWVTLVTSSDARLDVNNENTGFIYDSSFSREEKEYRLSPIIRSLHWNRLFVGDPIGKPHIQFWQPVLHTLGYNQKEDLAIMVGDSYRSDIQGVSQFGIVPILIDREGKIKPEAVPEAKYVIRSMEELQKILASEEILKQNEEVD